MTITIRTDTGQAEIGMFNGELEIDYLKWQADRKLSDQLLKKIEELLQNNGAVISDLSGVIIYKGPGSFTGLRIGITVANTLAYSLSIPIVSSTGENWINEGTKNLAAGQNEKIVTPEYGGEANITTPKK